ncbi:MAG: hypothetical protein IT204_15220 [Fimbriimonadaceae bacterium]|nr:hypothetical protein [Fimbriimonadaceae bacterium]
MRCLLCLALLSWPAWAGPAVHWSSSPVQPGEAVMLIGDDLAPRPQVVVERLADSPPGSVPRGATVSSKATAVTLLQSDAQAAKFVLPPGRPGLCAWRLQTAAGTVAGLLNRPQPWWAQGPALGSGTPGAVLRLGGICLRGGTPTVLLSGPRTLALPASGDAWCLATTLPATLPAGAYQVRVHSGWGGPAGWSDPLSLRVTTAAAWPTRRFDAVAGGADPTGVDDATEALQAVLDAAGRAGGGVVWLPRGRYQVSATLTIPRFTALRGERQDLTALFWPDLPKPPAALLRGSNSFAIEDLTVYATQHEHVIVGDLGDQPDAGNVRLLRVRVRANAWRGHLSPEQVDAQLRAQLKLSTGGGDTVRLGGANLEIAECDLYGSGRCLYLMRVRGARVHHNQLYNGRWGWYCFSGSDGLVFEDNHLTGADLQSTGGGLNCLDGSTSSQHVYYARNQLRLMHGWDREAMTSDAGGGAYCGAVSAVDGATLTLAGDPAVANRSWAGAGLFILAGRGRGQYRRVVAVDDRTVTVDSPWQVAPDASSTVTLTMLQRRYLFIDNQFADAGVAIQLYGMACEHVCAGNTSERTAGFHNFGMNYHGIQPSWYIQWLRNRITEGNVYRSGHDNYQLAGEAHLGVFCLPPSAAWQTPLTLGTVVRGNQLLGNAHLAIGGSDPYNPAYGEPLVQEVLCEGNTICDSAVGIDLRRAARGVVLRNNRTERVAEPLRDEVERQRQDAARLAKLLQEPTPLAAWSGDELRGRRVPDSTGHGFDLLINGPVTLEPGRLGQALRLRDQAFLSRADAAVFNTPNLTWSAWIRADTVAGRQGLFVKRLHGTTAPFVVSLWDGSLDFEATATTGSWSFNFRSPAAIQAGVWQHVAVVAQAGVGISLYVNGQLVASKAHDGERLANLEPLVIGREAWDGRQSVHVPCWFSGLLDDLRVWGRALSAAEVAALAR